MKTKAVTELWEFYRENCAGFKEPMRKRLHELDAYVAGLESENSSLRKDLEDLEGYDQVLRDRLGQVTELRVKAEGENAELRDFVKAFLCEHADYFAEGNYSIVDLDLEHAMHHNQAVFRRQAKELGIEVDG